MGTGYTRADTGNNIADGNIINAADLDGEFDALQSAFNETTGHTHDGTSSEGAPITFTGPAQEYVSTATELRPKANNTYDLGSATNQWKDLYVDGTANIDSLAADAGTVGGANITTVSNTQTLTNKTLTSPDINTPDIDGGTIDGTVIGGSTPAAISGTTGSFSGNLTVDTNTLFVDAANNRVGIVTSSPATQLEVVGTIRASGSGPRLSILDTGGATDEKEWGINGADGPLRIQAINDAGAGGGDLIEITRVGNSTRSIRGFRSAVESYDLSNFDRSLFFSGGVSTIGTATAHDLVVDTNNAERMRITSAGLVGIGTSSPAFTLDVNGSIIARTTLTALSDLAVSGAINYNGASTFFIRSRLNGGTVLIGTETPAGTLYYPISIVGATDYTSFSTSTSEAMRINSAGFLGIGTTAPQRQLHLAAAEPTIVFQETDQATDESRWRIYGTASNFGIGTINDAFNSGTFAYLITRGDGISVSDHLWLTAGSERMRINSAGNVGIGETIPDYKLDVNGTFGFTPGASVTPVDNGDVVFELTNNTTLTVKAKGSDGVVRSGTITLA